MIEYEIARRTPRYPFVIDATVTDTHRRVQTKARTITLGLFGCGIETSNPFAQGTSVIIRLSHQGAEVRALGMVAHVRPNLDVGIAFTDIDRKSERILELWIAEVMRMPTQKK
jgi:hypothetical protein